MPDGKRNSLAPEGDTDGDNGFYDEELQNATGLRRRVPLNHNSRGLNNISDRLLKTMVANEIKKSLNGEDNKRLFAHHRPVLHSESDTTSESSSDMVVVGVVLNSKQAQNEEVSKAIDMLQRNGVSCVYYALKDSPQTGSKIDDNNHDTIPSVNSNSSSTQELLTLIAQPPNENLLSTENSDLSPSHKKVSSPTVSTTSDYTSPSKDPNHDDAVTLTVESLDTSCTSTTPVDPNANQTVESKDDPPSPRRKTRYEKRRITTKKAQSELPIAPPSKLPPSPPIPIPEIGNPQSVINDKIEKMDQDEDEVKEVEVEVKDDSVEVEVKDDSAEVEVKDDSAEVEVKVETESTVLRRKKRRKRMYPYLSWRKSRNKKRKATVNISSDNTIQQNVSSEIKAEVEEETIPEAVTEPDLSITVINDANASKHVDPYEFEDSDIDNPSPDTFKTPSGRIIPINGVTSKKRVSKSLANSSVKKLPKKKSSKRSPRKRLSFSKPRAFSPDITDHSITNSCKIKGEDECQQGTTKSEEISSENKINPLESCVQPISTNLVKDAVVDLPTSNVKSDNEKLVLPEHDQCPKVPLPQTCDESVLQGAVSEVRSKKMRHDGVTKIAQDSIVNVYQPTKVEDKASTGELLVPAPPDDSLHDAPDSMQLRRSSFYSSISRNVRTNLEKYLDGRPEDLKPPKRPKKVKNGFLLHHGDNFPDDPEAPYRLHLATQVLLKLNKRRVKCKPKEDKGKSLLSYLKLQPKRVSRVGKHSKASAEESQESSSKESTSVFSGEWTVARKYICNICGQVENAFWDMVMHKGEIHPGIVVTHVELPENPPEGFRKPPSPRTTSTLTTPPACSKCAATFNNYNDLHRHTFECAGNAAILEEPTSSKVTTRKKRSKRKRGFKRRISGLPKKNPNLAKNLATTSCKSGDITKRRNSEVFKCEFCTREFKTEGWLKNHVSLSHSLPVSIPLSKLSLPNRASISSSRRFTSQVAKPTKTLCREA